MRALVIGSTGFVGKSLVEQLLYRRHEVTGTTRRDLDLAQPVTELPAADIVFQVAAITKFMDCRDNPRLSYRVNVDAQIEIADLAIRGGMFPVFISSDVVEVEPHTAYGHQKSIVEAYFRTINGAVVRPTRIAPHRVMEFCDDLIGVGERREKGVFSWR